MQVFPHPELWLCNVTCAKCNRTVEMLETTGINYGFSKDGQLLARAYCHGEHCDIAIEYCDLNREPDMKITVFDDINQDQGRLIDESTPKLCDGSQALLEQGE